MTLIDGNPVPKKNMDLLFAAIEQMQLEETMYLVLKQKNFV
jgi:hypothetical protein